MNDQFAENQPVKLTPSELFRLWADKIEKNSAEDFSGVFLIIPPKGEPISGLLIDDDQDISTFFAVVKTKLDVAVESLNDAQRQQKRW